MLGKRAQKAQRYNYPYHIARASLKKRTRQKMDNDVFFGALDVKTKQGSSKKRRGRRFLAHRRFFGKF